MHAIGAITMLVAVHSAVEQALQRVLELGYVLSSMLCCKELHRYLRLDGIRLTNKRYDTILDSRYNLIS